MKWVPKASSGGPPAFPRDLSIDEASFRAHFATSPRRRLSAVTINAHSTEVASCTFDEQRRVLAIAKTRSARSCRSSTASTRGSLEPRASRRWRPRRRFRAPRVPARTLYHGPAPEMAVEHFRASPARASCRSSPSSTLLRRPGYPLETLLAIVERCRRCARSRTGARARSCTSGTSGRCSRCSRPSVSHDHSSWLMSSLVLGPMTALAQAR